MPFPRGRSVLSYLVTLFRLYTRSTKYYYYCYGAGLFVMIYNGQDNSLTTGGSHFLNVTME